MDLIWIFEIHKSWTVLDTVSQYNRIVPSETLQTFFKTWGVREHRVSAAYHPHSNLHAETAVKSAKRILLDNTRSDSPPYQDKIARASTDSTIVLSFQQKSMVGLL